MPTYVVSSRAGHLGDERKASIARAIARRHGEATGAPSYLVQVVHEEKAPGDRTIGGRPADRHIWIRGDVRAGRSASQRQQLMLTIMRDVARIADIAETDVWIYLCNLAPTDMIEFGHVLPEPGGEAEWFEALPDTLRDELRARRGAASDGSAAPDDGTPSDEAC